MKGRDMKKLFVLLMVMVVSTGVMANELSKEEGSTVYKLEKQGIFTKKRTVEEWQAPIRTIDAASAIIKSDSRMFKHVSKSRVAAKRADKLIKSQLKEEKKRNDQQDLVDWILGVGLVLAIIF